MLMVSILCDRAGIIRGVTITAICLQMVIFIIRYPDIKPDTMIHPGARREEPACRGPPVYRQMYHIKMNNAMRNEAFVFRFTQY